MGGTSAPPASTTVDTPPPASPAPTSTPTPTPTPSYSAAPTGTQPPSVVATAAPAAPPSWLETLRAANIPVGKDEPETVETLRRINEERDMLMSVRPLLPFLNSYRQNAAAFTKWQSEQQKTQQAAQPSASDPAWKQFYNPPEFNPAWMQFVTKDAAGNPVMAPGTPPQIAEKLQAHFAFRQETAEKFLANPLEFIQGFVQQQAQAIADKAIQQHFGKNDDVQTANKFIEENAGWIYDVDPNTGRQKTRLAINPRTGRQYAEPILSPWGQRFQAYAAEEFKFQQSRGFHDESRIKQVAFEKVQRDFAIYQYQQGLTTQQQVAPGAPAKTPQQIANDKFLAQNNPPGARQPGGGSTTPAPKKVTAQNLRQIMLEEMRANGINDQTIQNAS